MPARHPAMVRRFVLHLVVPHKNVVRADELPDDSDHFRVRADAGEGPAGLPHVHDLDDGALRASEGCEGHRAVQTLRADGEHPVQLVGELGQRLIVENRPRVDEAFVPEGLQLLSAQQGRRGAAAVAIKRCLGAGG
eukprot:COSAG06_NODE_11560_length_1491_cov_2.765805_1_plen_136_part_00